MINRPQVGAAAQAESDVPAMSLAHLPKCIGQVEYGDVDAGNSYKSEQQLKRRIIEILLGKAEKEPDAGEEIQDEAAVPIGISLCCAVHALLVGLLFAVNHR